ncbi:acid protease [Apiospora arundinis]|uniref:Acid protease n=1 Tax=Apiospora arundinis TaxID=335852 RepID=A0ABR2IF92_9PEZI
MLLLLFILVGCCLSLPSEPRRRSIPQSDIVPSLSIPGVEFRQARPFSDIPKAPGIRKGGGHAKLKRLPKSHPNRQSSAIALFAEHLHFNDGFGGSPNGSISVVDHNATQYAVEVVLDGTPVDLVLNTAGSDTWVRASNFTCMNNASDTTSSHCNWGKYGATGFRDGPIRDEHFAVKNKDGSWVNGRLGYMNITLANVAVPNQEVAIASQGAWHGDNVTSGMLGMAYPSLTSAYKGNDLNDTSDENVSEYSPLFTSMVTDGFIEPRWSMAISRNSSDGVFSLGHLTPPVNLTFSYSVSVNLLIANLADKAITAYQPSYYAAVCDGFFVGTIDFQDRYPLVFDSATSLTYLPPDVAEIANSKFEPPATYFWQYGTYFVPCDAIPPQFAVMFGGSAFYINPVDMINHDIVDPNTGLCQTGITTGLTGPYVLGLTFLTNVAVGFDIQHANIAIQSRQYY